MSMMTGMITIIIDIVIDIVVISFIIIIVLVIIIVVISLLVVAVIIAVTRWASFTLFSLTVQVLMMGRHVFMGYLGEVEKTKEVIDDEGCLHSGDIGRKDSQGFLYITGRIKGTRRFFWHSFFS